MMRRKRHFWHLLMCLMISGNVLTQESQTQSEVHSETQAKAQQESQSDALTENRSETQQENLAEAYADTRIKAITIHGSRTFPSETIKSKVPLHSGERFSLGKTNQAILNLYNLGYFKQIEFKVEQLTGKNIHLHIFVTEKPALKEVKFVGNRHLTEKEITKKIDFKKIPAAEEQELSRLSRIIKSAYAEKGYHYAQITLSTQEEEGKLIATFTIDEGPRSILKRVRFTGNTQFHDKRLRSLLFTREDWLLSPFDHAGTYHPMAVEQDKLTLENFYQSNGYLNARVPDATVTFSENKKEVNVTFHIHEGDFYTIGSVNVPGNDLYSEKELQSFIPLHKGMPYSRELVRLSLERLKTVWGNKGYIYADVEPAIQPDPDTKTVDLTFHSDLGNQARLHRINIYGNKKTRDKVVRRQFLLDEGDLLTTSHLEASKQRVAGLGYFDPKEGVNWKINRIDDDLADIDLMLKEIKTGRFEFKLNYGGSPNSLAVSSNGIVGELQVMERNVFGKGMIGQFNARLGQDERALGANFVQPWLFDKPIHCGVSGHYSRTGYEELRKVLNGVQERRAGIYFSAGFVAEQLGYTRFDFQTGIESLEYYSYGLDGTTHVTPQSVISGDFSSQSEYQAVLANRFQNGTFAMAQFEFGQDTRNHHTHIWQGIKWNCGAQFGIPSFNHIFGFYKLHFDGHWYTPIINETDLVLHLHAHLGWVNCFANHTIPFRELYNIGGQASIRGWLFGQVGPLWYHPDLLENEGWQGEPIGARKAAFFNAELVFPLTEDLSMKGVVFYDGGSGWDTPNNVAIAPSHLRNNSFDYRHSIGIGLRLLHPQPMRIDWGFKLDKRPGETASEVSFSSYYDF